MTRVREATESEIPRLIEILRASPEAGTWPEADLRRSITGGEMRRCLVAEGNGLVAGFLLAQCAAPDEAEILTLAVAPECRRRGVASEMLHTFLASVTGRVFLEVRQSNVAAQQLYRKLGFVTAGVRRDYYESPREEAVLMQLSRPQ
jgi:ribosomal-protein-alanine N-acetyltransferase